MKSLDLNAYGVEAMQRQEMQTTDGGWIPLISMLIKAVSAMLVTHIIEESIANPGASSAAFNEGYSSTRHSGGGGGGGRSF